MNDDGQLGRRLKEHVFSICVVRDPCWVLPTYSLGKPNVRAVCQIPDLSVWTFHLPVQPVRSALECPARNLCWAQNVIACWFQSLSLINSGESPFRAKTGSFPSICQSGKRVNTKQPKPTSGKASRDDMRPQRVTQASPRPQASSFCTTKGGGHSGHSRAQASETWVAFWAQT